ncbi:hypothetical protein ACJ7V3_18450 [Halomonas elongata]
MLCSQVRTLDIEARQGWWVESMPLEIMDDVLARLAILLSCPTLSDFIRL